jgi:hypothetical protein
VAKSIIAMISRPNTIAISKGIDIYI